jgi:hypothetical protein
VTIGKGLDWGVAAPFPEGAPIANTNRELRQLVLSGSLIVGLAGGDLFRTVGGSPLSPPHNARLRSDDPAHFPIHMPVDVVDVELDDDVKTSFVTHLVGHDFGWRNAIAAMNVDFWGRYQLGPHAHPGDGVIDVYSGALKLADLFKIAPRARTGTHVPHPSIGLQRASVVDLKLRRKLRVVIDDEPFGRASSFRFTVRPDAVTIVR